MKAYQRPRPLKLRGSKRELDRLALAEEVCRAVRKALSHYATQSYYMNIALDWLLLWLDHAPKDVKFSDPIIIPKTRSII